MPQGSGKLPEPWSPEPWSKAHANGQTIRAFVATVIRCDSGRSSRRRPLRLVAAERHRRTRPERRGFRHLRRVRDRPQRTEARGDFLDKGFYHLALQVLGLKAVSDAAEIPQPVSGLRQRHPDMPAAAFARLTRLHHHRTK